jgi:hypothetical protein
MGGKPEDQTKLNFTLKAAVDILNEAGVEQWFLGYGTLLGILRDKSCIPHDDDIDIICGEKEYGKIIEKLAHYGIGCSHIKEGIIKTLPTDNLASIDFYFANVEDGNYFDKWEKVYWLDCLPFKEHEWKGRTLKLPHNGISKVKARYGADCMEKVKRKNAGGNGIRGVSLK